ncbi:hypothetical protein AAY473_040072 [Plecturocebus cupreus]
MATGLCRRQPPRVGSKPSPGGYQGKLGTKNYRLVQDLHLVNQETVTLHPTVPNSYTLLRLLPAEASLFTCLDLKDAFFTPESQKLFAFQWEDLESGITTQYTWTQLSQGFKNSLTIFGEALAQDLQRLPAKELGCVLLQYVDDLLLEHAVAAKYAQGTDLLLRHLETCGYKISKRKVQICQQQVHYLGFTIQHRAANPRNRKTAGGRDGEPFEWSSEQQGAFLQLKAKRMSALALRLLDLTKPFMLYRKNGSGGPDPDCGPMALTSGILVQTTEWSFQGIAPMSRSLSSHCLTGTRG